MEWAEFAKWLFFGSMGVVGIYIARSIEKLQEAVEKLTVGVAVSAAQVVNHDRDIVEVKRRVEELEKKANSSAYNN